MPQLINELQSVNPDYASGYIQGTTAAGTKSLTQQVTSGITFNGTNTYTVVTKGLYYIRAEQLISNGGNAVYLHILINGVTAKYGFLDVNYMADIIVSMTRVLNVGDKISISQQNATGNAWTGEHSSYQIVLMKRMA